MYVYIGHVGDLEVDFVAINEDGITYLQVAASAWEENTLKRVLTFIQKINDHYLNIS